MKPGMTLADYADALAAAVTAAGAAVTVWHGRQSHRIYRGSDYVEVFEATDGTGGFSGITGRDRGFGAALRTADRELGNVPILSAPAAPVLAPSTATRRDRRTGCPCGSLCETPRASDCASCRLDY